VKISSPIKRAPECTVLPCWHARYGEHCRGREKSEQRAGKSDRVPFVAAFGPALGTSLGGSAHEGVTRGAPPLGCSRGPVQAVQTELGLARHARGQVSITSRTFPQTRGWCSNSPGRLPPRAPCEVRAAWLKAWGYPGKVASPNSCAFVIWSAVFTPSRQSLCLS